MNAKCVPILLFPPHTFLHIMPIQNRENNVKGILDVFIHSLLTSCQVILSLRTDENGGLCCRVCYLILSIALFSRLPSDSGVFGTVNFNIIRPYLNPGEGGEALGCRVFIVNIWTRYPNMTLFWYHFISLSTPGDQKCIQRVLTEFYMYLMLHMI